MNVMHSHILNLVILMGLCGCTVIPTVQYRTIRTADDMEGMTDSYYQAQSRIEISASPASAPSATQDISITSQPVASFSNKVGIRAVTNWRSSTVVNIEKITNTDLVKSIGVEVTDTTAKNITAYGGAITKIVGLVAGDANPQPVPTCISPGRLVTITFPDNATAGNKVFKGSDGVTECIVARVSDVPVDAIPVARMPQNTDSHNFYYSACREVEIIVDPNGKQRTSKKLRIADPSFLQYVQFPPKGSITTHSECGISVKTEAAAPDNGAAIVDALATQAKAIKDAIEAAKK